MLPAVHLVGTGRESTEMAGEDATQTGLDASRVRRSRTVAVPATVLAASLALVGVGLFGPAVAGEGSRWALGLLGVAASLALASFVRAEERARVRAEEALRESEDRGRRQASALARDAEERLDSERRMRESEAQLRHSQKMEAVGRLAGGVAHDFNNLLTAILGYGSTLESRIPPDDPRREMVAQVLKAGERAASLTRQLLAVSRRQIVRPRPLDLSAVVREIEPMLRRLIGEDVELRTSYHPSPLTVVSDPGQIEQVVLNLAVNARDAMPDGGTLRIETAAADPVPASAGPVSDAESGPHAVLTVADTGVGMDEETKAHLFEPFFTTKEVGKGTGLGLATVYGIVRQNGGHVGVRSEPGRGATFGVYLPRGEPPASAEAEPRAEAAAPRGAETVLVVEDEATVRALVREVLVERGYRVLEASHGAEGLEVARGHQGEIHLVVTDAVMPGMGGREMVQRLARERPEARILYISGYTDDAVVRHGAHTGEIHFLSKPFPPEVLLRRVRALLDAPGRLSGSPGTA